MALRQSSIVDYYNFFGVVVKDEAPSSTPPPPNYIFSSQGGYQHIQSALAWTHGEIDDCLDGNLDVFQNCFLPLVGNLATRKSQGVLDLFNSGLNSSTIRPGAIMLDSEILQNLLPTSELTNISQASLPKVLQPFFHFFDFFDPIFSKTRALTKAQVHHLNLVHALARFEWSEFVKPGEEDKYEDWIQKYAEELYRYYVDLFAGKFVDRNGNVIKFDLSLSDLQNPKAAPQMIATSSPAVAGEMVSILAEFLGDTAFQVPFNLVPASPPKTTKDDFTCYRAQVISLTLKDNPIQTPAGILYTNLVGKIIASASSAAQKQVAAASGGLVRGAGVVAVNNEVLAEVVSSLLGSLAKKFVEKASFELLKTFIANYGDTPEGAAILKALEYIYGTQN
jgi:hypothetical protein